MTPSPVGRMSLRILLTLMAAASAGCKPKEGWSAGGSSEWRGVELGKPWARPDFTLRTLDGQPFDFRARTGGRVTLLFFGYTHCPDVCPLHMANIAAVLAKMPPADARKIDVVFVTTDPKRDTPDRLKPWLAQFDARFIPLTGSGDELDSAQVASKMMPAAADTSTKDSSYVVSHAAQVLAIAADDSVRIAYPFGTRQGDWAADLPRLITVWPSAVQVTDAFMYAPIDDDAALYATVGTRAGWTDTVRGVSAPFAKSAMLHGVTAPSGGLQQMTMLDRIALPAGMSVSLAPGGTHAMLTGLSPKPVVGDTVSATLVFSRVGRRTVRVPVRKYGQ